MEKSVKELFERYGKLFRMGLTDEVDMERWHLIRCCVRRCVSSWRQCRPE